MNLARRFNAGSDLRRPRSSTVADATRPRGNVLFPALKGRAKFTAPLCGGFVCMLQITYDVQLAAYLYSSNGH
jgi:hypothetical protein